MKICVIVDGFSAGQHLVKQFKNKEYPSVHVTSRRRPFKLAMAKVTNPDDYLECIIHDENIAATLEALSKYEVMCVVPGSESGVELADSLSESLNLDNSNGTRLSKARRNKFEMTEALKNSGVETALYFKSNQVEEIISWINSHTTYPVVVKALDSAGTDGVFICASEEEVVNSFNKLLGIENYMGKVNHEVLVQSFLDGEEYVVNSVSCEGKHYINDIWKYQKRHIPGHGKVYDRDVLLPLEGHEAIVAYAHKVLNALEIKFGPTHAEIMMTKKGPILVEVGARVSGGTNMELSDQCVGHNVIQLTVDCYIDRVSFYAQMEQPYRIQKNAMLIDLMNSKKGTVENVSVIEKASVLQSYHSGYVRIKTGDVIDATVDLFSAPAHFRLVHTDMQQILNDYDAIQKIGDEHIIIRALSPSNLRKISVFPIVADKNTVQQTIQDDMVAATLGANAVDMMNYRITK